MNKENRKYTIRKAEMHEVSNQFYHMPMVIEYKKKTCVINAGTSDNVFVFRYDNDHFFIMTVNDHMKYAGFELININTMEVIQDFFVQDTTQIDGLKKDFFSYTENSQADILAQWIQ
jgi:hypothetical protein